MAWWSTRPGRLTWPARRAVGQPSSRPADRNETRMPRSAAPSAPSVPRFVLDNVSCAFGSVIAVDHLSLAIMPGEFVSLLGPSGCGKTSTLRMIAGFLEPSSGTIAMDGDVISSPRGSLPPERRQMSMIFQSYAIWPNMTVAENVAFGLRLRRFDRETIRAKVADMLQVVQLG